MYGISFGWFSDRLEDIGSYNFPIKLTGSFLGPKSRGCPRLEGQTAVFLGDLSVIKNTKSSRETFILRHSQNNRISLLWWVIYTGNTIHTINTISCAKVLEKVEQNPQNDIDTSSMTLYFHVFIYFLLDLV